MIASRWVRRSLIALSVVLAAAAAPAQAQGTQQGGQFQPQVGQAGKDVVWVPTPQPLVDKMLDMAKVTPQDFVMDLGSGDGRTVITAAKRGARAVGVEFDPNMFALSKANAAREGVAEKAAFINGDLFEQDLSQATVITMFLLPQINLKLRPKILDLKPGTRIVSNSFDMGEWVADETETVGGECSSWCTAMLWIVPAKVEGTWTMGKGKLTLSQSFQVLTGTLETGGKSVPVEGKLHGTDITFVAGGTQYAGHVNGDSIQGTNWKAARAN
jgi:Methyltransferase domain